MLRYETLILSPTQITVDELSVIESYFEKLLSDFKGEVLSFERWGKYRLVYPVRKNDYGIYILVRFEIPEGKVSQAFKDLKDFFKIKCNEIVMRYVTIKLDELASLEYKRPGSLDAGRTPDLDTFLKEHKMETFLSNVDTSKKAAKEEDKKAVAQQEDSSEKQELEVKQTSALDEPKE